MTATAKQALAAELEALIPKDEAEQLALLPTRFEPDHPTGRRVQEAARRGLRGRPEGARNIATRQMLELVRRMFGDPLYERARQAALPPAALALELNCTLLEAAQFRDKILADLQGLFYAKLAPVDGQGNAVVPAFNVSIGGAAAAGDRRPPWQYLNLQTIEIPAQSETEQAVSHDAVSHEEPK